MAIVLARPFSTSPRAWFSGLGKRERLFLLAGVAAVLAFLLYFLAAGESESLPTASPTPVQAPVPAFHQPEAAAPPAPPPAPPAASVSGLVLRGVLGGGAAIIQFPDGAQRAIPVGRQFLPGVTLKAVGLHHVLLATASGDRRLEFNKAASKVEPATAASRPAQETAEDERRERETLEFRTGLAPQEANGRIAGFAIRPGSNLDIFARAGLRPGDVIVSINGQAFRSEEKVLELSDEIANSRTLEIAYVRAGKRETAQVKVN